MKQYKLIYLFFILSVVFFNSCSADDEVIDPALLEEIPAGCVKPSFLNVSAFINGNTVSLSWDKTSGDLWEVQYGTQGFVLGSGTVINFTPTSSLIGGLTSTTNYDFYIRTKCNTDSYSGWVGPVSPGSSIQICVDPTNLSALRLATDETKANVTWSANGDENSWQVQYGASGFVIGSGTILASATPSKVLSNLIGTTSYDVYVRSNCSANQNSDWVGPVIINGVGATSCTTPTNLTAVRNATTTTEATLNWAAGGAETSWEIQYGATGFAVGSGTSVTATTTTKTITGLATSAYDFYVRAKCSATSNSAWFGPINVAAASSGGSYYLRMKVDGTLVNFPIVGSMAAYNSFSFMINATNGTLSFGLQIAQPTGVGTYAYSDPNVDASCEYVENFTAFSSTYEDFTVSIGSIVITEIDTTNNSIKGTFNFVGKDDPETQSRVITEGEFYLSL